jgi:hypothetical protein
MPLSLKQLQDVCLLYKGGHKRCRYLARDDGDTGKWYCLKKTAKKSEIDDEANEFVKDQKKKGLDPSKQGYPLGNNCDGYPILKHIEQGFDKD